MKKLSALLILALTAMMITACQGSSFFEQFPEKLEDLLSNPGQVATLVIEDVEEINQEQTGSLPDPENLNFGMDQLESFRIRFAQTLDGKTSSNIPLKINLVYSQAMITPLRIVHLVTETDPGTESPAKAESFRFGNQIYLVNENGECSTYTENLDIITPVEGEFGMSSVFKKLKPGKLLAQGLEVNGVLTDQYQVETLEMHQSELKNVKAQVWYAQDGGYIVKFTGQAWGSVVSRSQGLKGSGDLVWEYDLTAINQVAEILLPEACQQISQGGVNDIPLPEQAFDITKMGSMLIFKFNEPAATLADYYRKEMPLAGYQFDDETIYEKMIILSWSKDGETIMMMISDLEEGSEAMITIEMK